MIWAFLSTVLFATAILIACATLLSAGAIENAPHRSPLENERRSLLARRSKTYRRFGQIVDELAPLNVQYMSSRRLADLSRSLLLIEGRPSWMPQEFVACRQIEGALAGMLLGALVWYFQGPLLAVAVAVVAGSVYVVMTLGDVPRAAAARRTAIKRRMPFAVDLIAMMLQAGSGFHDALVNVVRESKGHALGDEFRQVLEEINLGLPRRQALGNLDARIGDQDVSEFVAAVIKGEELGTPLRTIMQTQADQMRLRRSQWGEKLAAEAEVRMSFPILGIMLACMLLVLGPFVLPSLMSMGR